MLMPKTLNGITIQWFSGITTQVEWLCRRQSLDRYAEDFQRHNHPMLMPKTVNGIAIQWFNGITIHVEWLCRRQSLDRYAEEIQRHNHPMVREEKFIKIYTSQSGD